ncbi:hypothetical protein DPMN_000795, partial [Dreissena polymorpha]
SALLGRENPAGLDHQAHEMLALNQLYKSISPELKFKCISEGCQSVTQAVALVEMYESIMDGGARRKASIYMVENVPEQQAKKAVQDLQECVRKLMMGQSTNNKPPYNCAITTAPRVSDQPSTASDGVSSTSPGTVHTADCRRFTGKRQAVNPQLNYNRNMWVSVKIPITAVKHWRPYILGHKVLLRTDNAAVSWMKSLKNPTGQCFELEVQHRPGRLHTNCDALSRVPCKVCARQEAQSELHSCNSSDPTCMVASKKSTEQASSSKADNDQTPATDWEPDMLRQKQLLDPDIMPILSSQRKNALAPDVPTIMSRPYDLKRHVGRWHKAIADGLNQDIFTEAGAFYLALYPKDYSKAAKEAREAVKAPKLKKMEDWEAGWKIRESNSWAGHAPHRRKTPCTIPKNGRDHSIHCYANRGTGPPIKLSHDKATHASAGGTEQTHAGGNDPTAEGSSPPDMGLHATCSSGKAELGPVANRPIQGPLFHYGLAPKRLAADEPGKKVGGFPTCGQHVGLNPDQIMDKYNFLILPGSIPQPRSTSERRMRIANYVLLSDMVKGRSTNILILQMLEQTFGHRDTSTDEFLTCRTDGKTDRRKDGQRQNNIPSPMAGDNDAGQSQSKSICK